jgi:hypothetical protein
MNADVHIHKTINYNLFSFAEFNRSITDVTVKKLIIESDKEDNFKYFPILVDNNYKIIDGQHRFIACTKLNKPIYYIIKNVTVSHKDVRSVNTAGKKHSLKDVFDMECKVGNAKALQIKKLMDKYSGLIPLGVALPIYLGTQNNGNMRAVIESDNYSIIEADLAHTFSDALIDLTGGYVSQTAFNALSCVSLLANIDACEMASLLKSKGVTINPKMKKSIMLNTMIEAYNFRKIKSNRIHLK